MVANHWRLLESLSWQAWKVCASVLGYQTVGPGAHMSLVPPMPVVSDGHGRPALQISLIAQSWQEGVRQMVSEECSFRPHAAPPLFFS